MKRFVVVAFLAAVGMAACMACHGHHGGGASTLPEDCQATAQTTTGNWRVRFETESLLTNCTPAPSATHEGQDVNFSGAQEYIKPDLTFTDQGGTITVQGEGLNVEIDKESCGTQARIVYQADGGELICQGSFTPVMFDMTCERIQFKTGGGGPVTETCELNGPVSVTARVF